MGAELSSKGVHFRVWAPKAKRLEVALESSNIALSPEPGGYFSGIVAEMQHGTRYRFRLDSDPGRCFPDPASRFQPDGPFGSSQVVDHRFAWTDAKWRGARLRGQVLYEMHIGTFTRQGTWRAAAGQLKELASAGMTAVEVMPVADFPGRFGWGYDGVNLFAPTWLYGSPDDFRNFVNTAHNEGIGVILDVVYNHLGPDGNFLKQFSDSYFSHKYTTEWGEAWNFDDTGCEPVREYILSNAAYWIGEYHLDGLRLDATQSIFDSTSPHILEEITSAVRKAAKGRDTLVIAENEPQDSRMISSLRQGGFGMDAMWNDDYHHSAVVALTGHSEAYYINYSGLAQEFVSAVKHGFLYQGQWYPWQKKRRGKPSLGFDPAAFVIFVQNHDQIANSGSGLRIHQTSGPGQYRAIMALTLLAPSTPMLFQGQEFAASTPFRYFSDHKPEIAKEVLKGRAEFMSQFPSLRSAEAQAKLPDPGNPATFESCKLDFSERDKHGEAYRLHKDLLRIRRTDPVLRAQTPGGVDGALLGDRTFVLRFAGASGDDRLLLVNLMADLHTTACSEPLMAPPDGFEWRVIFSTEEVQYGGPGVYESEEDGAWHIPGHAAVLLRPVARDKSRRGPAS